MMLKVEKLTAEAFAPFGEVIEARPSTAREINAGYTTRFHALATMDLVDGAPILSIFNGRPRPLEASMLERHPFGTQAFMPLQNRDWLVVVAKEAHPEALRAFLCRGDQGVQYGRNVWHHPLLVLGETAHDFLIADRDNPESNLEEVFFEAAVPIAL